MGWAFAGMCIGGRCVWSVMFGISEGAGILVGMRVCPEDEHRGGGMSMGSRSAAADEPRQIWAKQWVRPGESHTRRAKRQLGRSVLDSQRTSGRGSADRQRISGQPKDLRARGLHPPRTHFKACALRKCADLMTCVLHLCPRAVATGARPLELPAPVAHDQLLPVQEPAVWHHHLHLQRLHPVQRAVHVSKAGPSTVLQSNSYVLHGRQHVFACAHAPKGRMCRVCARRARLALSAAAGVCTCVCAHVWQVLRHCWDTAAIGKASAASVPGTAVCYLVP